MKETTDWIVRGHHENRPNSEHYSSKKTLVIKLINNLKVKQLN